MLDKLSEIAPKALVVSGLALGVLSYTVTGPELASRIVRADHLPKCEAGYSEEVKRLAEAEIQKLVLPVPDARKEAAVRQLRELQSIPFLKFMERHPMAGVYTGQVDTAMEQYEREKQKAVELYKESVARIRSATATHLGRAGNFCGCLGDAAIEETRTEWAIFAGTFGLIRPAKIADVDVLLARQRAKGLCASIKPAGGA